MVLSNNNHEVKKALDKLLFCQLFFETANVMSVCVDG